MRFILILAAVAALAACDLMDQTTFAPSPSQNPVFTRTPRVDPRAPLVTISQGTPVPAYSALLQGAVRAAQARDPNVQFDVTIVVPNNTEAAAGVSAARPEALAAMQQIAAAGVPDDRINLRAATTDATQPRQIRIYVR